MRQLVLFTCTAIATFALVSCGSDQKTIESKLASIDAQPRAEKQYAALLAELDSKCQEDRQVIAELTLKAVELVKQADKPGITCKCFKLYRLHRAQPIHQNQ